MELDTIIDRQRKILASRGAVYGAFDGVQLVEDARLTTDLDLELYRLEPEDIHLELDLESRE